MNQQSYDLNGLTEDQREAITSLVASIKKKTYFADLGSYPPIKIKEFLEANRMKESSDTDEAERGRKYEKALFTQCGYEPIPDQPPEH